MQNSTSESKENVLQNQQQTNLGDRFKQFQKLRSANYKFKKYITQNTKVDKTTEDWKQSLRKKFLEQARKYIGVPYAQKYHEPEERLYDSPLFLDCSGLIRQVVFDLREDFCFTLAKWNQVYILDSQQAYQYDMLDESIEQSQLQPGDLVFISAKYHSKYARNFQHNMVHVEIFTGLGDQSEGTLAARWQKGVVQDFDSFRFESKNYYDQVYHFKSINRWLEGQLKSFCKDHDWVDDRNLWLGDKYSIFNLDDDGEKIKNEVKEDQNKFIYIGEGNNAQLIQSYFQKKSGYILLDREKDQFKSNFYFKWIQHSNSIDFLAQNKQIVNHIGQMFQTLGSKAKLLDLLYAFRSTNPILEQQYPLNSFIPVTFRLDMLDEFIAFINYPQEENDIWIVKPERSNQGKGIQLISSTHEFKQDLIQSKVHHIGDYYQKYVQSVRDNNRKQIKDQLSIYQDQESNQARELKYDIIPQSIVQKYIKNVLLYEKKKFDIRCFVLVACTKPLFVLFYHGYLRLSLLEYDLENLEDKELQAIHLTNAAIQKKHPLYKYNKGSNIKSMKNLEQKILEMPGKSQNNISILYNKIKQILTYTIMSAEKIIKNQKNGQFELFGCDILLDNNLCPYLLEMNTNPALFVNSQVQEDTIPPLIYKTISLVEKICIPYENIDQNINNLNQQDILGFEILIDERTQIIKY